MILYNNGPFDALKLEVQDDSNAHCGQRCQSPKVFPKLFSRLRPGGVSVLFNATKTSLLTLDLSEGVGRGLEFFNLIKIKVTIWSSAASDQKLTAQS